MALARSDDLYAFEAYEFLCHALSYTQEGVPALPDGDNDDNPPIKHVTVDQLLEGVRKFALDQFGLMTPSVFRQWGVKSTADLGVMVHRMIDAGLWHKAADDEIDSFETGYDFDEGFVRDYEFKLEDW